MLLIFHCFFQYEELNEWGFLCIVGFKLWFISIVAPGKIKYSTILFHCCSQSSTTLLAIVSPTTTMVFWRIISLVWRKYLAYASFWRCIDFNKIKNFKLPLLQKTNDTFELGTSYLSKKLLNLQKKSCGYVICFWWYIYV